MLCTPAQRHHWRRPVLQIVRKEIQPSSRKNNSYLRDCLILYENISFWYAVERGESEVGRFKRLHLRGPGSAQPTGVSVQQAE